MVMDMIATDMAPASLASPAPVLASLANQALMDMDMIAMDLAPASLASRALVLASQERDHLVGMDIMMMATQEGISGHHSRDRRFIDRVVMQSMSLLLVTAQNGLFSML